MLSDNLKTLRRSKGLSQEELAIKLNVVRQTVSKWEKGLSVPDSGMLICLAEELDTTVGALLGEPIGTEQDNELKALAAKLEVLNKQLAQINENRRRTWRTVFVALVVLAALLLVKEAAQLIYERSLMTAADEVTQIIGGTDGPTAWTVAKAPIKHLSLIVASVAAVIGAVGLIRTRRG
ncbi:MAG: helix-turn-helix transcriptional regulator [Clostridia bacterium]|nr:helix-turn-helix transcriptional regulator [Clostridia bacterium]